jgi:hypothetical protein
MDPDSCYNEIKEALHEADNAETLAQENVHREYACNMFEALDLWILNGGALPKAWQEVK